MDQMRKLTLCILLTAFLFACGGGSSTGESDSSLGQTPILGGGELAPIVDSDGDFGSSGDVDFWDPDMICGGNEPEELYLGHPIVENSTKPVLAAQATEEDPFILYTGATGVMTFDDSSQTLMHLGISTYLDNVVAVTGIRIDFYLPSYSLEFPYASFHDTTKIAYVDVDVNGKRIGQFIDVMGIWDVGADLEMEPSQVNVPIFGIICSANLVVGDPENPSTTALVAVRSNAFHFIVKPE